VRVLLDGLPRRQKTREISSVTDLAERCFHVAERRALRARLLHLLELRLLLRRHGRRGSLGGWVRGAARRYCLSTAEYGLHGCSPLTELGRVRLSLVLLGGSSGNAKLAEGRTYSLVTKLLVDGGQSVCQLLVLLLQCVVRVAKCLRAGVVSVSAQVASCVLDTPVAHAVLLVSSARQKP